MVSLQSEPACFLFAAESSSSSSPPFPPPVSRVAAADHFLAQAPSPLASPKVVHTVLFAPSSSERLTPAGSGSGCGSVTFCGGAAGAAAGTTGTGGANSNSSFLLPSRPPASLSSSFSAPLPLVEEENASLRFGVACCAEACTRARAASTRRFMADWPTLGTLGRPMGLRAGEEEEEETVPSSAVEVVVMMVVEGR